MKALSILLCDDSTLVRKKLRELLESNGCSVLEAVNGLEGVKLYAAHKPDAVFMDIVMPELDGIGSLKKIKDFDSEAKVVMISSVGTPAKLLEALKGGAIDFIQKPYDNDQIIRILTKLRAGGAHA